MSVATVSASATGALRPSMTTRLGIGSRLVVRILAALDEQACGRPIGKV
jgi:hypothetical protein